MTTTSQPADQTAWHTLEPTAVARELGVEPDDGLSAEEVQRRLEEYGPNPLPTEPPPSVWVVSLSAMNLGLVMCPDREPVWSSTVFSCLAPVAVGVDKALQLRRERRAAPRHVGATPATPGAVPRAARDLRPQQ